MKPKDTEKLLELLKKTGSIDAYLQENKDFLLDCNINEYLRALIQGKRDHNCTACIRCPAFRTLLLSAPVSLQPTPSIQGCSVKYVHRYAAES